MNSPASSVPINLTKQHLQVLEYSDNLFTRWSLRKNSYLFKHMKQSLQIPLFIIAEQRRISQITQAQPVIIQALKLSEFVQVNEQNRMIKVLELPTLRFMDQVTFIKFQNLVKSYIKQRAQQDKINMKKPLQYIISNKTQDGYYYITIKSKETINKNKNILKNIAQTYNKQKQSAQKIKYTEQPLYQDIKENINKQRKARMNAQNSSYNSNSYSNSYYNNDQYNKQNQTELTNPVYSRQNMMMMYPGVYYPTYSSMSPQQMQMYMMQTQGMNYSHQQSSKSYGIFIRKAVDSDEQQQIQETKKQVQNQQLYTKQQNTSSDRSEQNQIENTSGNYGISNNSSGISNNNSISSKNNNLSSNSNANVAGNSHANNKQKQSRSNQPNKGKKYQQQKQKQKGKKNTGGKVVIDDNDFPTIG